MTRRQANAVLLGVAAIWGLAFVAQARGMAGLGPWTFSGLRFLIGAAVVGPLAWAEARRLGRVQADPALRRLDRTSALGTLGLGLLLAVGMGLQQTGLVTTSVTNAGFLTVLYAPLVPLLLWAGGGGAPPARLAPALVGCLLGTWWLTGASLSGLGKGDAWVIASALPWALHVATVGLVGARLGGTMRLACGQFLVAGLIASAVGLATEPFSLARVHASFWPLAYAGVVAVGIGFTLQAMAQRHTLATEAGLLLACETLFAAVFGALLQGDRLGGIAWLGAALMFASVLWIQLAPAPAAGPDPSPPDRPARARPST